MQMCSTYIGLYRRPRGKMYENIHRNWLFSLLIHLLSGFSINWLFVSLVRRENVFPDCLFCPTEANIFNLLEQKTKEKQQIHQNFLAFLHERCLQPTNNWLITNWRVMRRQIMLQEHLKTRVFWHFGAFSPWLCVSVGSDLCYECRWLQVWIRKLKMARCKKSSGVFL